MQIKVMERYKYANTLTRSHNNLSCMFDSDALMRLDLEGKGTIKQKNRKKKPTNSTVTILHVVYMRNEAGDLNTPLHNSLVQQ